MSFRKNLFNQRKMDNFKPEQQQPVFEGPESYDHNMENGFSQGREPGPGLHDSHAHTGYRRNRNGEFGVRGFSRDRFGPVDNGKPFNNVPDVRDRYVTNNGDGYGPVDNGNSFDNVPDVRDRYVANNSDEYASSPEIGNINVHIGNRGFGGNAESAGANRTKHPIHPSMDVETYSNSETEDDQDSVVAEDGELAKIQSTAQLARTPGRPESLGDFKVVKARPRRRMNRSKEDIKSKNHPKGINDPENILIVNLKDTQGYSWKEIAEELNDRRIGEGKRSSFTANSIQNRYNRNAPYILGAHGIPWVPVSQRKKRIAGRNSGIPPIPWDDRLDRLLLNTIKEVDSQRWARIATLFTQESDIPVTAKEVAMRAEQF